jgi:hypothetical protein
MTSRDVDKLRREVDKLRRENARLRKKNRRLADDYEKHSDLAVTLTEKILAAGGTARHGPRKKNAMAFEKYDFVWREYQAALARGEKEMAAREAANKAAGEIWGGKPHYGGGHYSELSLRKIIKGG